MENTTVDQGTETVETFASFRGNRGGPIEPVSRQSQPEAAVSAQQVEKPNAEPSPASDPEHPEQASRAEKRKAELKQEIDDLLRQRKELKRETEPARTTNPAETGAQRTAIAPGAANESDVSDPEPAKPDKTKYTSWEQYDADYEKWIVDRSAWAARSESRKLEVERQKKSAEESRQVQFRKDREDFEKAASEFAKEEGADDFDDLYQEIVKRPVLSQETGSVTMYGGKDGARLLHHLMTNPEKLEEIEGMKRPIDRLNALYDLKHELKPKVSEKPAPTEKPKSNAPAPGSRLNGSSGGGGGKEPASFAQYRQKRFA